MFRLMLVLLLLPLAVVEVAGSTGQVFNGAVKSSVNNRITNILDVGMTENSLLNPHHRSKTEQDWPLITQVDLTAIYQALKFDDSKALSAANDINTLEHIRHGYKQALEQAQKVTSYAQYRSLLNDYSQNFADLQVDIYDNLTSQQSWWSGAIVKFKQGYWVSFSNSIVNLDTLVSELERYQSDIYQSDYLVLDLRGNYIGDQQSVAGGNRRHAERVAMALFGKKSSSDEDSQYRKQLLKRYHGQLILLTDDMCSNSCLLMAELFLDIGAVQVGRTTAGMNHYYDTKYSQLPSGLSTVVTLTKVEHDAPKQIGPFKPRYTYEGDMNNTQKLKSWVLDLLTADRD